MHVVQVGERDRATLGGTGNVASPRNGGIARGGRQVLGGGDERIDDVVGGFDHGARGVGGPPGEAPSCRGHPLGRDLSGREPPVVLEPVPDLVRSQAIVR